MGFIELSVFLATIIMFWITVAGLFLWNRAENRSDYKHTQSMLDSQRSVLNSQLDAQRNILEEMRRESAKETKEFHAKLCEIDSKVYILQEQYYNWLMGKGK